MAGLFDNEKQADMYADARPSYPKELYSKLAALTPGRHLAWDAGTGNGQAALGVAEHYEQLVATDVSEVQLERAIPHPRIRYLHTPLTMEDDELLSLIGGENSVDLITVAQAVHWFNLPKLYALASRLLRKPGGVIAVWCCKGLTVSPTFDDAMKAFYITTLPFWDANANQVFDEYKTPMALDIPKELSFGGLLSMVKSWSAVATAKSRGLDLLTEEAVMMLESAWGGSKLVMTITYKGFLLAGKVKI